MRLKHNPVFQRHKIQIAEAIEKAPAIERKNGQYLFDEVLMAAEALDNLFEPGFDGDVSPQIMIIKKDEFQKKCRDLGEWLTDNAPNLKLTWD